MIGRANATCLSVINASFDISSPELKMHTYDVFSCF